MQFRLAEQQAHTAHTKIRFNHVSCYRSPVLIPHEKRLPVSSYIPKHFFSNDPFAPALSMAGVLKLPELGR